MREQIAARALRSPAPRRRARSPRHPACERLPPDRRDSAASKIPQFLQSRPALWPGPSRSHARRASSRAATVRSPRPDIRIEQLAEKRARRLQIRRIPQVQARRRGTLPASAAPPAASMWSCVLSLRSFEQDSARLQLGLGPRDHLRLAAPPPYAGARLASATKADSPWSPASAAENPARRCAIRSSASRATHRKARAPRSRRARARRGPPGSAAPLRSAPARAGRQLSRDARPASASPAAGNPAASKECRCARARRMAMSCTTHCRLTRKWRARSVPGTGPVAPAHPLQHAPAARGAGRDPRVRRHFSAIAAWRPLLGVLSPV